MLVWFSRGPSRRGGRQQGGMAHPANTRPVLCCLLPVFASPMLQVQLMDEKSLRKMLNTFEKKVRAAQHSMAEHMVAV